MHALGRATCRSTQLAALAGVLLSIATPAAGETWVVRTVGVSPDAQAVGAYGPNADVMVRPDGRVVVAGALGVSPTDGEAHLAQMMPGEMFFEHRELDTPAGDMSTVMDHDGLVQFALYSRAFQNYRGFGQDRGAWGGLTVDGLSIDSNYGYPRPTLALDQQSIPTLALFDLQSSNYSATRFDPALGQWGPVEHLAERIPFGPPRSPSMAFNAANERITGVLAPADFNAHVEIHRQTSHGSMLLHNAPATPAGGVSVAVGPDDQLAFAYVDHHAVIVVEHDPSGIVQHELNVGAESARLLPRSLTYDAQGQLALAIGHHGAQREATLARLDADSEWQLETLPVHATGATVTFDANNMPYVAAVEPEGLSLVARNIEPLTQGQFNLDPDDPLDPLQRFAQAIKQPEAYLADHPGMSEADLWMIADHNGDGVVDERDAYAFADSFADGDESDTQTSSQASDSASISFADIQTRSDAYIVFDLANTDPEVGDGDENFFDTVLVTGKTYQPGDSRGDLTSVDVPGIADQRIDADDIDYLMQQIASDTPDMRADLNDQGLVNYDDVDVLVQEILGTTYGDANLDGSVNLQDFFLLRDNFGQGTGWAGGNFDGSDAVNLQDFFALRDNFGTTMSSETLQATDNSAASVPEPSGAAVMGMAALWIGSRRRSRHG